MAGNARPRMPSMGSSANELERVVTGAKYWLFAVRPATVTNKDYFFSYFLQHPKRVYSPLSV